MASAPPATATPSTALYALEGAMCKCSENTRVAAKPSQCACLLTLLWGCGRRARSRSPAWPCSWGQQRQMRYAAAAKQLAR